MRFYRAPELGFDPCGAGPRASDIYCAPAKAPLNNPMYGVSVIGCDASIELLCKSNDLADCFQRRRDRAPA